jgi:two-component system, NtrC family, response regulator HydG
MAKSPKGRILVVDDHPEMVRLLADQLDDAGYHVELAESGRAALAVAEKRLPDVVLTDLRMEEVDGFDVLAGMRALDPTVPVLIMTGFGAIDSAIEAIKRGAYHYLTKPFRLEEVLLYVERALSDRRLRDQHRALSQLAIERAGFAAMVGGSEVMRGLYDLIERVAQSSEPVLVRGESGTGKELVARALHFHGPRRDRAFVVVNCTALPEALLESELFGHARGAFTGATTARRGLLVEADGGTLFLDEIGDMPAGLQAKLLRVLEDGEVRPVGADVTRKVDVRIIAASHRALEGRESTFRQDLFYRLNVVPITVPPLRERPEDIPALIEHFLGKARERNPNVTATRLAPEVLAALARCPWPGNVRELENAVTRLLVVSAKETIELADLQAQAPQLLGPVAPIDLAKQRLTTLRELETEYITWVIEQCGGNKTRAAEILGIDPSTIHRRGKSTAP